MNIAVVCIDSLRNDHVRPDTMPNLWALLEQGVRCDQVETSIGWTLPSVSAMLYGDTDAWRKGPQAMVGTPSVAARLSGAYASGAFLGLPVFGDFGALWLFRQFDTVSACPSGPRWSPRPIAEVTQEFLSWRDRVLEGQPWFAYLHLCEVHEPYLPARWYGDFPPPPEGARDAAAGSVRKLLEVPTGRLKASDAVGDYLRRRYREYCRRTDEALLPLWAAIGEDTLLIIVSDHGEALGEGGVWHHGPWPAMQRPEVLSVLAGCVYRGGTGRCRRTIQFPWASHCNEDLWQVIEAHLPEGEALDDAQIEQRLKQMGYV